MNIETQTEEPKTGEDTGAPKTILVVDDNSMVSEVIVMSLARLGHSNVDVADGAREALRIAERTRPDFVIMDIGMPEMDGIETARRMRTFHQCPVIFSTGLWDYDTLRRSRDLHSSSYLVKPFSPAQLQAAIEFANHTMRK